MTVAFTSHTRLGSVNVADARMVCHVDSEVSVLVDKVKYFTYLIQVDPGVVLYNMDKVSTLPPVLVSVKASVEILPPNVSLLVELTANVPLKVALPVTHNVLLSVVFPVIPKVPVTLVFLVLDTVKKVDAFAVFLTLMALHPMSHSQCQVYYPEMSG